MCLTLSALAGTEFTFATADDMSQTKDDITVALAAGGGNAPYVTENYLTHEAEMRLYINNTITVSGPSLTDIQLVFAKSGASNKAYADLSASAGSLVSGGQSESYSDWRVDRWTGDATQVVFTLTGKGQRRIQKIVVNGDSVTVDPIEETVLPTEADLQSDYTYSEPTQLTPPDTVIAKQEYAFIENNVLVHCSLGSIMQGTDTTFAYFNCNAGYELSFTATQSIKGLAIDGFGRKGFSATVDHGEIDYLTDADADVEGWPVMVIRDIDATSVTLSCPKQIRCYAVRVYFENNPEPLAIETVDGESAAVRKMWRDGQLFISAYGRTYSVTGAEL